MARHKEAECILATPALRPCWNQHYTWSKDDDEKLKILAAAGAHLDRSALALGRSAESLEPISKLLSGLDPL
jgi:non-ribosomal peptide synthetase component E (peptide arylation enzyme)